MMENQTMQGARGQVCKCRRNFKIVTPILMILFATIFSLGAQGYLTHYEVSNLWPVLVGLAGIVKLEQANCPCDRDCNCDCR